MVSRAQQLTFEGGSRTGFVQVRQHGRKWVHQCVRQFVQFFQEEPCRRVRPSTFREAERVRLTNVWLQLRQVWIAVSIFFKRWNYFSAPNSWYFGERKSRLAKIVSYSISSLLLLLLLYDKWSNPDMRWWSPKCNLCRNQIQALRRPQMFNLPLMDLPSDIRMIQLALQCWLSSTVDCVTRLGVKWPISGCRKGDWIEGIFGCDVKFDLIIFRPGGLNEKYAQMIREDGPLKRWANRLRDFYKNKCVLA